VLPAAGVDAEAPKLPLAGAPKPLKPPKAGALEAAGCDAAAAAGCAAVPA
jgi:hypothetical protein